MISNQGWRVSLKNIAALGAFILLAFGGSVFAQVTVAGRVVDVIDGRTVVIDSRSGKMNAQLQYIDTPESGQKLFNEIHDHLRTLVGGKEVQF